MHAYRFFHPYLSFPDFFRQPVLFHPLELCLRIEDYCEINNRNRNDTMCESYSSPKHKHASGDPLQRTPWPFRYLIWYSVQALVLSQKVPSNALPASHRSAEQEKESDISLQTVILDTYEQLEGSGECRPKPGIPCAWITDGYARIRMACWGNAQLPINGVIRYCGDHENEAYRIQLNATINHIIGWWPARDTVSKKLNDPKVWPSSIPNTFHNDIAELSAARSRFAANGHNWSGVRDRLGTKGLRILDEICWTWRRSGRLDNWIVRMVFKFLEHSLHRNIDDMGKAAGSII